MILTNGIAVHFAFCFVASRAYITCMILLNELVIIRARYCNNLNFHNSFNNFYVLVRTMKIKICKICLNKKIKNYLV